MKRPAGFSGSEEPERNIAAGEPAAVKNTRDSAAARFRFPGFGRRQRSTAQDGNGLTAPVEAGRLNAHHESSDDLLTVPLDEVRPRADRQTIPSVPLTPIIEQAEPAHSGVEAPEGDVTAVASPETRPVVTGKRLPGALAARLNLDRMPGSTPKNVDRVVLAERELKRAQRDSRQRERRDQRRFTALSRGRRRHWWIAAGAVLVLVASVLIGVFTPVMAVRSVEVVGAKQVNVEEIEHALGRFDGVPLALVGDTELHRALEPFPLIQMYSVERIPPDTLRVHIEERMPVIAIAADSGVNLVDAAGVLTGNATEIPAGIVRASGGVVDTASPAFSAAATVIRDLPEDVRLQVAEVRASGEQDIEFLLHSGSTVVWGDSADTQRKAVVVRAMLVSVSTATRIDVSAPEAPVFQ